jgi:oligopeptidase B
MVTPEHGLRLPPRRRPAGDAEGQGNSQRLRCVEVCDRAADGAVAGRHAHSRVVVYRRDFVKDGSGPLHIQGYGAYGYAYPPGFSTNRLSLLDRGFACAIAHIPRRRRSRLSLVSRRQAEKRTNTFNDFVDVTRFLIAQGFAAPGRVTAAGGSAGGELMGAIVNQAPELYGAVAAHVPFVDVLNTMLDGTLPLTPGEWSEWGNPIDDKAAFDFIRSYSPTTT